VSANRGGAGSERVNDPSRDGRARRRRTPPGGRVDSASALDELRAWMAARGWRPHAFQEEMWAAWARGESGLLHVSTGAGKTYAAVFAPLAAIRAGADGAADETRSRARRIRPRGPRLIYLTPLRALARDLELAIRRPVDELGWPIRIESRTGDTSSSARQRQRRRMPDVLLTTPESLCVLLAHESAADVFGDLDTVVVDEWHELIGSKRGSQTELALARLRALAPALRTWALSATLGNLDEAARAAVGVGALEPRVVRGEIERRVTVETLVPPDGIDQFPWAGHLGLRMLEPLLEHLDLDRSTLVFTNTRSQAELWYRAFVTAHPEHFDRIALHHGSLDRAERELVEDGLARGRITLVVATSSLDLGVDFAPVEQVVQIGSPRGIARLIQRAGRSGHRPGAEARVLCVPTNALELFEYAAVRDAVARGEIEARRPLRAPLDVLAQHLVTLALARPFDADEALAEIRTASSYRDLPDDDWRWTLDLLAGGGALLDKYPEYHRLVRRPDGRYEVADRRTARQHRLNIGTITADGTVRVQFLNGRTIGHVEERFVARLRPGESFLFGGRTLELVGQKGLDVRVRKARGDTRHTPRWIGGRLPLSDCLAAAVRRALERCRALPEDPGTGRALPPEILAAAPIVDAQRRISRLPAADELLLEILTSRDGTHLFAFPFEGRLVHEGLAALLALRLGRRARATFSIAFDDRGFELLVPRALEERPYPFAEHLDPSLWNADGLVEDIAATIDLADMARRRFRDVARVAGLVWQTWPGRAATLRNLQASAGLLFDVFSRHDPGNLLVRQARDEVLEAEFDRDRMLATLARLRASTMRIVETTRPSPLAFPLVVERVRAHVSHETLLERVDRLRRQYASS
jgi:ATP-dependent Lhr-like helicase